MHEVILDRVALWMCLFSLPRFLDVVVADANGIDAPTVSVNVTYVGRNDNPPQLFITSKL